MVERFAKGQAGALRADQLETELNTLKLDRNWNKTVTKFLVHQGELVQQLASYRPAAVTEAKRYHWLKSAVATHNAMNQEIGLFLSFKRMLRKQDLTVIEEDYDNLYTHLTNCALSIDN